MRSDDWIDNPYIVVSLLIANGLFFGAACGFFTWLAGIGC